MAGQKRSHDEFAEGDPAVAKSPARDALRDGSPDDGSAQGSWETFESKGTKKLKKIPKQQSKNYPSITHSPTARLQTTVKLSDLQNLILYVLADSTAPRWVAVNNHNQIRKVVVVMVPGLEAGMFNGDIPLEPAAAPATGAPDAADPKVPQKHTPAEPSRSTDKTSLSPDDYYPKQLVSEKLPDPLKPFAEMFSHIWPIKSPGDDKYSKIHSPLQAILTAPIAKPKDEKKKGPQPPKEQGWQNKRTPITAYLAKPEDLLEYGDDWTLHPAMYTSEDEKKSGLEERRLKNRASDHGWVDTAVETFEDGNVPDGEIQKGSVTAGRKVLAVDCEMCKTGPEDFELTRISIVDWNGDVIMDEFVKPERPIIDYLTQFSGITEDMLKDVTTTLADIQKRLVELITPQTILVGHSINSDLNALKITHPFIVDTSLIFPHPRGPPLKCSLKWLAQKYLQREIQRGHGSSGHDSIEDARTCLDLVKQKCEKGPLWGTSEANGESIFKRLGRQRKPKNQCTSATEEFRTGAVVDWGKPQRGFGGQADVCFGCENDDDVAKYVVAAVTGISDKTVPNLPTKGVDFVWARMRELEAVRGWWTRTKTADNAELLANALKPNSKASSSQPAAAKTTAPGSDVATTNQDPGASTLTEGANTYTASDVAPESVPSANVTASSSEHGNTDVAEAVRKTTAHLKQIYDALPPCSAFLVYSGTGDPRETTRLQQMKQQWQREYRVKNWDELSVKWTDTEDQALRNACKQAREGVGFVVVK